MSYWFGRARFSFALYAFFIKSTMNRFVPYPKPVKHESEGITFLC